CSDNSINSTSRRDDSAVVPSAARASTVDGHSSRSRLISLVGTGRASLRHGSLEHGPRGTLEKPYLDRRPSQTRVVRAGSLFRSWGTPARHCPDRRKCGSEHAATVLDSVTPTSRLLPNAAVATAGRAHATAVQP